METITITNIQNTPKAVFTDKEHYLKFRETWKQLINSEEKHNLSARYHLLYAILRNKDWRKGFTSATNKNKLANGRTPDDTLISTLRSLNWLIDVANGSFEKNTVPPSDYQKRFLVSFLEIFKGTITSEMLKGLRPFIPTANDYADNHLPYKEVPHV